MSLSGFLMYGTAQKNKTIGAIAFAFLAIYLTLTSAVNTLSFLCLNLGIIFIISLLLKKFDNQIVSSVSILIYSIVIDIICFFMFSSFSAGMTLFAYILSGILFNLKSALPVFAFASIVNLLEFVNNKSLSNKYLSAQELSLMRK